MPDSIPITGDRAAGRQTDPALPQGAGERGAKGTTAAPQLALSARAQRGHRGTGRRAGGGAGFLERVRAGLLTFQERFEGSKGGRCVNGWGQSQDEPSVQKQEHRRSGGLLGVLSDSE